MIHPDRLILIKPRVPRDPAKRHAAIYIPEGEEINKPLDTVRCASYGLWLMRRPGSRIIDHDAAVPASSAHQRQRQASGGRPGRREPRWCARTDPG